MLLKDLNEQQKKAVITTEGPVMAIAGAGSGKTRVLTHRIAYLLQQGLAYPQNILAVTFTNKAAREMKERVQALTGVSVNHMWVSTFHSFCARLLRLELKDTFGYRTNFVIIDEDDAVKIIKEILKEDNIDVKQYKPKLLKGMISKKKNKEIVKYPDFTMENYFPLLFDKYNERLLKDNLLDFDDLITVTIRLFKEKKDILDKYRLKFKYVMVDEFQDTNETQYELIKLIADGNRNIFIVGDQDQSIYSFRGAKVENIDLFLKDYKDTQMILLEQNYRSTKNILIIANRVISKNSNRIEKNLFTTNEHDELPVYYHTNSAYDEVMFVIDKIKELNLYGYSYNDFAILYRANALSRQYEDMFIRYNIPYVIYGGISFYERKEIKDMIAYLRLIINNNDDFSFKRIVNEPKRKIGDAIVDRLKTEALTNNVSLFEAIDLIKASGIGYNNLLSFKFTILELLEYLEDEENKFIDIIDAILNKTGYKDMLKADGEEGEDRLDNIREFKSFLKEAEESLEGNRIEILSQILNDLALKTDTDNKYEEENCVKLMTYHQSKGLEYKVVFMVAMEQGIFPSSNCILQYELEEERRVCYVGITRAKEKLYITNAASRYLYGSISNQRPSQYIEDMGLENLNVFGRIVKTITAQQPIKTIEKKVEQKNEGITVGTKINHKAFGDGIVVEMKGDIISVAFASPFGIKKLMVHHPSIRKIS